MVVVMKDFAHKRMEEEQLLLPTMLARVDEAEALTLQHE